jgi:hypothetical protein
MELFIKEDDCVGTLQERFSENYPHLKLRFRKTTHDTGGAGSREQLSPLTPLDDIRCFHTPGYIDIGPTRRVTDVENDFMERFGLHVQVLRQAGNTWLETTHSDEWQLGQQESEGAGSVATKTVYPFAFNRSDAEY